MSVFYWRQLLPTASAHFALSRWQIRVRRRNYCLESGRTAKKGHVGPIQNPAKARYRKLVIDTSGAHVFGMDQMYRPCTLPIDISFLEQSAVKKCRSIIYAARQSGCARALCCTDLHINRQANQCVLHALTTNTTADAWHTCVVVRHQTATAVRLAM